MLILLSIQNRKNSQCGSAQAKIALDKGKMTFAFILRGIIELCALFIWFGI